MAFPRENSNKSIKGQKTKINGNDMLKGYEGHYSENSFWDKIKSVANKAGGKVVYLALLLYYTATAETTSASDKIKIYSAIGYFILPIDLIPDFILIVGYTDDVAVLYACYKIVLNNITPTIKIQAKEKLKEWFKGITDDEIATYLSHE